ncbi:putative gustatory receptor 36b [Ceratitis capitata]|uniref:putative gustatory receptor 36b n=1 Tax=Ceratitis capitata TaxID=7213 RepID=UPI00032A04B2|nr:putative gustatory receptor 36b [Ceratitis capitata]
MHRVTYWVLLIHHYYMLAVGIVRFRYDFVADKPHTTTFITYYSVVANVLTICSLPWIYHTSFNVFLQHDRIGKLALYIFVGSRTLRVLAVVIAIVHNWLRREELLTVIREFNFLRWTFFSRFTVAAPAQRHFEIKIVRNILSGLMIDVSGFIMILFAYSEQASSEFILSSIMFTFVSNILYLVINQYYFALRTVILFGNLMNQQLTDIMKFTEHVASLQHKHRNHVQFKARCRLLSQELDELSVVYWQLQTLAERITDIFKWQGLGVLTNMYIFNVSLIYTVVSMLWTGEFTVSHYDWVAVLMATTSVVYLLDVREFLGLQLEHMDIFNLKFLHLETYSSLPPLDKALERSVERFHMQLSINKYEMSLLGLFKFNGEVGFSMFASMLLSSILVIQFEYQYFH